MADPTVCFITAPKIPSGVDHWRALTPCQSLNHFGYAARFVPLGADLPAFGGRWPEVVHFNQRGSTRPGSTKHLRETMFEPRKVLYAADCCDDPEPDRDSPLAVRNKLIRRRWSKGSTISELILDHLSDVHLVTVNSEPMAEIVRKYNRNVEVIPDLIEPRLWDWRSPPERPKILTVGVAGGDTHGKDWRILAEVWEALAEKYDWLRFVVVGHEQAYLKDSVPPSRYRHVAWMPIDKYGAAYKWIDIGCAPLTDAKFNLSKSPIKYYEYSLAGAATVASPLLYSNVIKDGVTGALASTLSEWVNRIIELIEQPRMRREMVARAQADVRANYSLNRRACEDRMEIYRRHYRRVYNADPKGAPGDHGRQPLIALPGGLRESRLVGGRPEPRSRNGTAILAP